MNNWRNDPPEDDYPEALCPECGADICTVQFGVTTMRLVCDDCGHAWVEPIEQEQDPLDFDDPADIDCLVQEQTRCPHDQPWEECNACMIAGDLAFDAAREARR